MNAHVLKPWQFSFLIHAMVLGIFLSFMFFKLPTPETIQIPIEMAAPVEMQNLEKVEEKPKVVLKSVNTPEIAPEKNTRQVFGASRDSYTDEKAGDDGVSAKKGNTLTKEADTEELKDSDATSLPTPTEEYLVSEMPVVLTEVRPAYPKEAREKQISGSVALDILVDAEGKVRQVSFIEGPEIFRQGAIEAMKKFSFKPAKVDGKPVAVRFRYSIKFDLEF